MALAKGGPMRAGRTQVLPLLLLLVCMFGCNAGEVLQLAAAVAVTTVRIAAVAAVVAAQDQHRTRAREEAEATIGSLPAEQVTVTADGKQEPSHCTELRVEVVPPAAPGSPPPPRAFACGENVLIQDEEGRWRRYDEARDTVQVAP